MQKPARSKGEYLRRKYALTSCGLLQSSSYRSTFSKIQMPPDASVIGSINWFAVSAISIFLTYLIRAFKGCHAERFSDRMRGSRINVNAPHIEKSGAIRDEINCASIGRPARLIVKIFTFRNSDPFAALRGDYMNN